MADSVLFKPTSVISRNDRLLIALFLAVIVHALLLVINIKAPEPKRFNKDIEITLVTKSTPKPPEHARYLAPEHQIGSGQKKVKLTPPKQKIPSEGQAEKHAPPQHPEPVKPQPAPKMITQKVAKKPVATAKQLDQPKVTPQPQVQPTTLTQQPVSLESLQKQLAQLGAQIVKNQEQGEEDSRIKFVSSVSTHRYVAAQYQTDVRHKIEHMGTLNFPDAAMKNISLASGIMDIGIKANGSIHDLRIRKSSGYPAVDAAALKAVRMCAPFAPLPKALLKELKVLVLHQPFSYSIESGMSAK